LSESVGRCFLRYVNQPAELRDVIKSLSRVELAQQAADVADERYRHWPAPLAEGSWQEDAAAEFFTSACRQFSSHHAAWLDCTFRRRKS
jgi:hypothetical protein